MAVCLIYHRAVMTATEKIRNWVTHNYQVKLLSLLSALFLWFYVVTDNTYPHAVAVPLHITNVPDDWILLEQPPENIAVLFRGTGKAFMGLGFRNKRFELDITQTDPEAIYPLDLNMIRGIPRTANCQAIRILDQDSILIRMEQALEKRVPIIPDITVSLQDGYTRVGDIGLEPDSILLRGPRSIVKDIESVKTGSFFEERVSRKLRGEITLSPPESDLVTYSSRRSEFFVDVQRIHEIVMTEIPIEVINVPNGTRAVVVPPKLSLKLRGGVDLLMNLTKDDIQATIDYRRRRRSDEHRIPASINHPKDVTFSEVTPSVFELYVERQ